MICKYPSICLVALLTALLASAGHCANPVDVHSFETPEDEVRYRALIAEFRCPKCLNNSLEGSNAPIAQDLRRTVYRLAMVEGLSDQEVRDYLQQRYGNFVLYDPPLIGATYLLWFGPLVLLLLGVVVWRRTVRNAQDNDTTLDAQAEARLQALLREER